MNYQLKQTSYNISIIQNTSYIITTTKVILIFPKYLCGNRCSSSMWLTDRTFLQIHVTFCEYFRFREFRRTCILLLLSTLNKKVRNTDFLFFFQVKYT